MQLILFFLFQVATLNIVRVSVRWIFAVTKTNFWKTLFFVKKTHFKTKYLMFIQCFGVYGIKCIENLSKFDNDD